MAMGQTHPVTIKFVNLDSANSSPVLVQGYYLNGTRTLYVLEEVFLTPNEVETRNYYANFDTFQFVFTTSGLAAESTEISVWGKNASGQLVTAHRLVSDELLGSEVDVSSAFVAFRDDFQPQPLTAFAFTKVIFPSEKFDLNNEYDTATGNFIPKQDGVFSFNASIEFLPDPLTNDSNALTLLIRVNGTSVALEFLEISGEGLITVSTIQQLQAGEIVEVLARTFISGNINGVLPGGGPDQTRFEGALISK